MINKIGVSRKRKNGIHKKKGNAPKMRPLELDTKVPGSSKYRVKIAILVERGISVFGGTEEFEGWLSQRNMSLGDQKPVNLLSTRSGVAIVEDALAAMEFGNVL